MDEVWVVIDIGCIECGVDSEPVGIYRTMEEAQAAKDARNKQTNRWRNGGQTHAVSFKMDLING